MDQWGDSALATPGSTRSERVSSPGDRGRNLLSPTSQGRRQCDQRDSSRGHVALEDEIDWHAGRGHTPFPYRAPRSGVSGACMRGGLQPGGGSRRFGPWRERSPRETSRRRRGMDPQSGQGEGGRAQPGRASRAPSTGRGSDRRCSTEGGPPRRYREGEKEEKECRERQEKEKREEGKEGQGGEEEEKIERECKLLERWRGQGGRLRSEGSCPKGPKGFVQRDGPRSEGPREKSRCPEGQEALEEKGGQKLLEQQREFHEQFVDERGRTGGREHLRRSLKSPTGSRPLSWRPMQPGPETDAGHASSRGGLPRPPECAVPSRSGLLPPAAAEKGEWADAAGAHDVDPCRRPAAARKSGQCGGHSGSEDQECRAHSLGKSLVSISKTRDTAGRGHRADSGPRVHRSSEGGLPRSQSEMVCNLSGGEGTEGQQGPRKRTRRRQRSDQLGAGARQERKEQRRKGRSQHKERLKTGGSEEKGHEASPRVAALDETCDGADGEKTGSYEGGMVAASPPCNEEGAAEGRVEPLAHAYEPPGQSVHVLPAKPGAEDGIHFDKGVPSGPTGLVEQDIEIFDPETFGTQKKDDALFHVEGRTLGSCGHVLLRELLGVISLRSQPTGRRDGKALFPLPTSRRVLKEHVPLVTEDEMDWMVVVCLSLNSMWGDLVYWDGCPHAGQVTCLVELGQQVKRICSMQVVVQPLDWESLFKVKTVDYQGEEVKVAKWFNWSNISPALPNEVGVVPLESVCSLGCYHYVTHFDEYLKPSNEWIAVRAPRVMVEDTLWGEVCRGLVKSGVCTFLEESEVFRMGDELLLNGLFGVSKEDWTAEGTEIYRLIMNLVPLNAICRPMAGDVETLPSWGAMSPFFLQPSENLLVSSEDVKCFFYTMRVPEAWVKFLAFNKAVPDEALPEGLRGQKVYLASRVLPMGFLNSVSLAQHLHRNLVSWSLAGTPVESGEQNAPELELRKDRSFSVGNPNWRVYLDNYDLLERVESTSMVDMEGTVAPGVLALRQEYPRWQVPRNEKKAVQRSGHCEMQGATIDGVAGLAYPRESKLCRYFALGMRLAQAGKGTQKQWQVVCGGLVYFSMFRRPLLGSLNAVWRHIEGFNQAGRRVRNYCGSWECCR